MKLALAAVLAMATCRAMAATAYVSDQLILGVYSEENNQGQRLATLHSGASLETLGQSGEFTHVRLNDGTIGWVKSAYLTDLEPATVRLKILEEELDRSRATTPALAEAAARNEAEKLKSELAIAHRAAAAAPADRDRRLLWGCCIAIPLALGIGYWLGYATLARRVRNKFGGIKVY